MGPDDNRDSRRYAPGRCRRIRYGNALNGHKKTSTVIGTLSAKGLTAPRAPRAVNAEWFSAHG
ncbi:hypothetical protein ABIA45_007249 [Bradyrhizobium sp. USDA 336]